MLVPPLLARFGVARLEDNVRAARWACARSIRTWTSSAPSAARWNAPTARCWCAAAARYTTHHWLDYASVTTTENFVLCAAAAQGESTLTNAASEPHVQEFCRFMAMMGADIDGIGTSRLAVRGGAALRAASSRSRKTSTRSPPSWRWARSPAATWWCATTRRAISADRPHVRQVRRAHRTQGRLVARIPRRPAEGADALHQQRADDQGRGRALAVFPGGPAADLHRAGRVREGNAMFWNKVYDGALGWTGELSKFGAHVFSSDPHRVVTFGGNALTPAVVESPSSAWPSRCSWWPAASRAAPRSATPRRSAAPIRASSRTCAAWACRWRANEE